MAGPYDSVISLGGQSFVDGLWRVFGPALEGLTNPLPLAIPGFANAQLRITELIPDIPGPPQPGGGLNVTTMVEVMAEALLHVVTQSGAVTIVGPPNLQFPAVPSPSVIPVPVDLTPGGPIAIPLAVVLSVEGPSPATRYSLKFTITKVEIGQVTIDPNLVNTITANLQNAINQVVAQLGIGGINQPAVDPNIVAGLVAPLGKLVSAALDDALTGLIGETGRLLYPSAAAGASNDAEALATGADARFVVSGSGEYVLQIAFKRATSSDIPNYPSFTPTGLLDCNVLIGNRFLLELICCVVQRLPAFGIVGGGAVPDVNDVQNKPHTLCFNFTNVGANFGPIPVGNGGLSVCLDAWADHRKRLTLVGRFVDTVGVSGVPDIADIKVDFELTLDFDVDSLTSITNLRGAADPKIDVDVSLTWRFQFFLVLVAIAVAAFVGGVIGALIGGILGSLFGVIGGLFGSLLGGLLGGAAAGASVGVIAAAVGILVLRVGAWIVTYLLKRAVRTLLSGASLLPSPVAVPPGVLDAFGKFAPSLEVLDDLICHGVLHTPTSPWALLPRIGPRKPTKPDRPPRKSADGGRERRPSSGRPRAAARRRKS
jgi:hypothetical protein